jgi:ankyrin repeat protein
MRATSMTTTMAAVKLSFREAVEHHDVEGVRNILAVNKGLLSINNIENDELYSPLMLAALKGSVEIVQLLVEQGRADVNLQNKVR